MTYPEITSVQNLVIKQIVQLHSAKGRKQHQQFIAQGVRICSTLAQNLTLLHVYTTMSMLAHARTITSHASITLVTDAVMNKISTTDTPSGIVGIFAIPSPVPLRQITTPGLVLVGLQDPGNVGTLIRSAAAFACNTVIVVESTDVFSPKVVQASAGTIGMAKIINCTWQQLVAHTRTNKISLSALVVNGGNTPQEIENKNTLLVVGNEAHGLTKEQQAACDQLITLPMPGKTESLNAAVAGSLTLYLITQVRS